MKPFTLAGTSEENFKKLEVTIRQLLRKTQKTATFASPPVPISFFHETMDVGNSFNYMISIKSYISELCFYCDKIKDVSTVTFNLEVINKEDKIKYSFIVPLGVTTTCLQEIELAVSSKISITHNYEGVLSNVFVGFPLKMSSSNFKYKKLVIDELDVNEAALLEDLEEV